MNEIVIVLLLLILFYYYYCNKLLVLYGYIYIIITIVIVIIVTIVITINLTWIHAYCMAILALLALSPNRSVHRASPRGRAARTCSEAEAFVRKGLLPGRGGRRWMDGWMLWKLCLGG